MEVPPRGIMIMGHTVEFPEGTKPFPAQLAVMSKVILALKKRQNALLESPTGSGKTLALLCSSLAWQRQHRSETQEQERVALLEFYEKQRVAAEAPAPVPEVQIHPPTPSVDDDFESISFSQARSDKKRTFPESLMQYAYKADQMPASAPTAEEPSQIKLPPREKTPVIYFCSRTHSQITQVVQELRRCPAASGVRMVVLGSKKHYCVNPKVRNLDAGKINDECSALQDDLGCAFRRKLKIHNEMRLAVPNVWDIEDLVKLGEEHRECPYYYTHLSVENASLVFCPYNYIMDPSIRAALKIDLKNSIVILDEAHNIEDVCRSSASMELTWDQLEEARGSFAATIKSQTHPQQMYAALLKLLNGWARWLEHVQREKLLKTVGYEHETQQWSGVDCVAIMNEFCGLNPANIESYNEIYQTVATAERENDDENRNPEKQAPQERTVKLTSTALMAVLSILNVATFMFRNSLQYVHDYKLVVIRSRPFGGGRKSQHLQVKLCLWCLHAGVAFSDITSNVRSVILTSGTLSPMTSFAGELGTTFPITLEANHVVDLKKQVFIGSLMTGPNRVDLSATYSNQQDLSYQDSLGQLVLKYSGIIPGGLLVFLPSYRLMTQLHQRWEETGLLDEISQLKQVFLEPRSAGKDFDALLEEYKEVIESTRQPSKENKNDGVIDLTESNTSMISQSPKKEDPPTKTGAVFMAVYRGKVSEGIDFSNDNARGVLAIGIPFPNIKEQQVALKQEYQNARSLVDKACSNGRVWYEHQAFRALNQALGRCIRHRLDYGAIILVDSRHRHGRYVNQLSKWTRSHVVEYEYSDFAIQDVAEFFQRVTTDPDLIVPFQPTKPKKKEIKKKKASTSSGWVSKKAKKETPPFIAPGTIRGWMTNHTD